MKNVEIAVNLAGMQLANPTMLASGILGYSTATLRTMVDGGAGGIVTKSVGLKPRQGYVNPTVVQTACGLINAMGLPNPGIDEYVKELHHAKASINVPLIASVFGYSADEYATIARKAVAAGVDAVELNVSCPHVKNTGSEIAQDPKVLSLVISKVKVSIDKPVFVKLSPNVTSIVETADIATKAGADGLVIMNTIKAMAVNVETAMPILGNKVGGLSGPAVKPIALRCVYEVYGRGAKIPIVGCGGIMDWQDAVEFLLVGASAVQIGTAVSLKGPHIFGSINRGVEKYLKSKGFRRSEDIVGLSHRR